MQDFHLWATFVIIGATIIAYASERFSMEAVSLGSLSVLLIFFGLFPYTSESGAELTPGRLLAGFSDPALATVIALLIVGQGLFATDAVDEPARNIGRLGGASGRRAIFLVVIAAGILSAFLNNTPVVVIFIPILTVIAAQRNLVGETSGAGGSEIAQLEESFAQLEKRVREREALDKVFLGRHRRRW